jgi:hypothetical protein
MQLAQSHASDWLPSWCFTTVFPGWNIGMSHSDSSKAAEKLRPQQERVPSSHSWVPGPRLGAVWALTHLLLFKPCHR